MASEPGIKQRVREVLEANTTAALSMGDLMSKAGIPKTRANDVSAALYKLRGAGLVRTVRGPSTSPLGPRFVKTYLWVVRGTKTEKPVAVSPMAGLGVFRI